MFLNINNLNIPPRHFYSLKGCTEKEPFGRVLKYDIYEKSDNALLACFCQE
jgi:hypothetical protein